MARTGDSSGGDTKRPARRDSGAFAFARRWGVLVAIIAIMALGFSLGWQRYFTLSTLIRHEEALQAFIAEHRIEAVLLYAGGYAGLVALSFPGASLLTVAAGFLLGWLVGGAATVIAATLGALTLFLAVRTSLGESLRHRAGPFLSQLSAGFREDAVSYLLFLRLTPVFPFWLVNVAPALFHVGVRPYVLTTFFGIIPGTFAYAFFGAGLGSVIDAQKAANPGCAVAGTCHVDLSAVLTPELIGALAALGAVSLIPLALKAWRRRSASGRT